MLWLFDANRATTAALPEHESLVLTLRFDEHSEWTGKFPASAYDALAAAEFCMADSSGELFLVEQTELVSAGRMPYCTASGRSASALLHTRAYKPGTTVITSAAGAAVESIIATLTAGRVIPGFTFGAGDTLGDSVTVAAMNRDMGDLVIELLQSSDLGFSATLSGTDIVFDVLAPVSVDTLVGEQYGNASSGKLAYDERDWKNFATVTGEGGVSVDVDWIGTDTRRELIVDATSVQRTPTGGTEMSLSDYQAALTAYGSAALANHRRITYAQAETSAAVSPGDVLWYDTTRYSASLMASEVILVHENGTVTRKVALGTPSPHSLRQIIRRQ